MNRFTRTIGAIGILLAGSATAAHAQTAGNDLAAAGQGKPQAAAKIIDTTGKTVGHAWFASAAGGGVRIHLEASGLPAGTHGIHFHETGKCDPPDFKSANAHLNPTGREHGFNNPKGFHAGDLPNIDVKPDGTVNTDLVSNQVSLDKTAPNSLFKEGGTALVIHAKADDYVTDPSGNSGDRIACGVIR